MERSCELCSATLTCQRGRRPPFCTSKYARVIESGICWLDSSYHIQRLCTQSAGKLRVHGERRLAAVSLFAQLGQSSADGEKSLDAFLAGLSAHQRQELLSLSNSELQRLIALKLDKLKLSTSELLRTVDIPNGLPEELDSLLCDYRALLIRRYSILIDKNHRRSPSYVVRAMLKPISFCVCLAKKGIQTWGQVGNTELASFLEDTRSKLSTCLKRFIKYAQNKKNPFKKPTPNKPRRGGGTLIETPRPQIIHPNELRLFLERLRQVLDDDHYLWAWLVCKLGLTVKRASELTLADIKINEQGRCVLRPYEAWISLPKSIEAIVIEQANKLYPVWKSGSDSLLGKLKLLSSVGKTPDRFSYLYLQNKAVILRASAIYAMMENGHLDRVTLKKTIGISMATLAKLERLFSVDVHRRLDPEFIKLRNVHITGQVNHE